MKLGEADEELRTKLTADVERLEKEQQRVETELGKRLGSEVAKLEGHTREVRCLCALDGDRCVSGGADGWCACGTCAAGKRWRCCGDTPALSTA